MDIEKIYSSYKITPTLQLHQKRVAGVCDYITTHFNKPLDKDDMIKACLLHDMGNIVKFDFSKFPEFFKPEGVEYWKNIQNEFIQKYGHDDHMATELIVRELGVNETVFSYIDAIGFSNADIIENDSSFEKKICLYADQRVGPYGVSSLLDRLEESKKRYTNHPTKSHWVKEYDVLSDALLKLEKQIFDNCSINPEDVTDETIDSFVSKNHSI